MRRPRGGGPQDGRAHRFNAVGSAKRIKKPNFFSAQKMCSQKSKIKADLFRKAPFAPACVSFWATAQPRLDQSSEGEGTAPRVSAVSRDGPVPPSVALICDDASVRYCTFAPKSDSLERATRTRDIVEHFARPVVDAFAARPDGAARRLHTYVYVFDKRALVPCAKSGTQSKRAEASQNAYAKMHGGSEGAREADAQAEKIWAWTSRAKSGPILGANGEGLEAPLPPWDIVKRRPGARDAVICELSWLLACYLSDGKLPAGSRFIIDGGADAATHAHDTLLLCETGSAPRWVPGAGNACGEADIAAQWWAAWPAVANGPQGQFLRGDVLLRTTDTDYLPISLVAFADRMRRAGGRAGAEHNVFVCFNTPIHVPYKETANFAAGQGREGAGRGGKRERETEGGDGDGEEAESQAFAEERAGPVVAAKKTDPDAVPCRELYDVRELCKVLANEHEVPLDGALDACVSFVAAVALSGNDYIARLPRFTYATVWSAYRGWVLRRHEGLQARAARTAPARCRFLAHAVPFAGATRVNVPPGRLAQFVKEVYREILVPWGAGQEKTRPLKRARTTPSGGAAGSLAGEGDDGSGASDEESECDPLALPRAPAPVSWRHIYLAANAFWPPSRAHLGPPTAQALVLLWERVFWTVNYVFSATASSNYKAPPVEAIGQWK